MRLLFAFLISGMMLLLWIPSSTTSAAPIEGLSNFATRVNDGGSAPLLITQQLAHVFQTDNNTYQLLRYEGLYSMGLAIDPFDVDEEPRLFACLYTMDLYQTDASLGRGTFVANITSQVFASLFGTTLLTFTPSTPIILNPNSFYRIERRSNETVCGFREVSEALTNPPTGPFTFLREEISSDGIVWNPTSLIHTFRLIVERRDIALGVFASCIGPNLRVDIVSGDGNFNITADSGDLQLDAPVGSYTFTGPRNETGLTVTEIGGDGQSIVLGDFNCFVEADIAASAVCDGADLRVTIANGDTPYTLTVTTASDVFDASAQPWGVYIFPGPNTFDVEITEEAGDFESLTFTDITCTAPVVPIAPDAPIIPVASNAPAPDVTALGCDVTALVENAPDNTYCRVLMQNGAVVNFSGAIPQNLIDLGVILAVDVYRLQGGQSITDFGGYSRICLAGQGRLFYLDARTAPRVQVELQTETDGNFTCGWIPAAGTLVLTRS